MIRFGNIKLIVDPAMGKLVRWLRFLGFDTLYDQNLNMHHLVLTAKREYRILLSSSENTYLQAKKASISSFLVPNSEPAEQLQALVDHGFDFILPEFDQTRCSNCNTRLTLATIEEEERLVPEGTRQQFSEFYICRDCDQMYWKGSHWDNIMEVLKGIQ